MQHYEKPLAGMVICGSGPYLICELNSSQSFTGFPDPVLISAES